MTADSYFYYTKSNKTFSSAIQATISNSSVTEPVYFYYHNHLYKKVNWGVEPKESLPYLYREQAQRIRDTYDYVVLFYSGGYDSTNILETFYYNNIKIDKIVIVGAFSQDKYSGDDNNHNGELYKNAFPYIEELGLTAITQVYDYAEMFNSPENFSVYEYGNDWLEHIGSRYSPTHWFWRDIENYVIPNNMLDKKVALIWGKDKPKLYRNNNQFGFKFKDTIALAYGSNYTKNINVDKINFYWDPHKPDILVKQLHTLLNLGYTEVDEDVDHAIYNLKKPLFYKSPKSKTLFFSLRDNFLMNHKTSDVFNFYHQSLTKLHKKIGLSSVHGVYSEFYPISDI